MAIYPLLLQPALHTRVWGGRKLAQVMGKTLPTDEPYGESWEMHDTATIENGIYAGKTVFDVLTELGTQLVGEGNNPAEGMPLLVKILDAADWLSVQVHPNDEQARVLEGDPRGKTEAWVVLAAEPGAQLIIGVKPGSDRGEVAEAIRENRLEPMLISAEVKPGDVLYIPAGTIHALGPGLLIYEIQQSSDVTYRLYDWGRMGLDGKPRPLHIEKGVQVSTVDALPEIKHPAGEKAASTIMVKGEFFTTTQHHLENASTSLDTEGQYFHVLTCIKGEIEIRAADSSLILQNGRTALIPAALGEYTLIGSGDVLRSWQG